MELSDAQKELIDAEEIYREVVRSELVSASAPDSYMGQLVQWLNEPLGIWFLSAVLVGVVSEAYKIFQAKQAAIRAARESQNAIERARIELIRQLDGEIALRLNRVRDSVLAFAKGKVDRPVLDATGAHYPEFADRSLTSLMYELQSVLREPERQHVRDALGQWFILQHWEAHKGFAENQSREFSPLNFFMPLLGKVFIPRWSNDIDAISSGRQSNG